MKLLRRFTGLTLAGIFAVGLLASCAQHPNEEEIKIMEESKSAALAAEQEYQNKQAERKDLEKQVEAKKKELSDAQRELEAVKKRVEEMKNKAE